MFHVGQQVVCIERHPEWLAPHPEKGCVYTIRGVYVCPGCADVSLCLEELPSPREPMACSVCGDRAASEQTWDRENFRPVKTTSIAVFEALLAPTPELVA